MRFQSYFNSAIKIIQSYDGVVPLQHYLKQYFSLHKKHGSKDRKIITHVCYNFYRSGKSFSNIPAEEKLKIAIFICNDIIEEWKFLYDEEWLSHHSKVLEKRIDFIQTRYAFSLGDVFPFSDETSETLDVEAFTKSLFIQPDVFIRIRPGYYETVRRKLQQHNIIFTDVEESCISLSPATNISTVINVDEEAIIQDYSSQQVKDFLKLAEHENRKSKIVNQKSVWDCCAGSGGKSILSYDVLDDIELTVSDIRPSIIQNLKQRFAKAGIKKYKSMVYDAANSNLSIPNFNYDLIICDAPCTGSGTWGRTPEQLYFFNKEKINKYALRQQKIVSNAIQFLKSNGYFLYVTCSVFNKENEAIAGFIQQQFQLDLIQMELIKGYDKKADTMFAALFKKN